MVQTNSARLLLEEMPAVVASVFETMLHLETAPAETAWFGEAGRLIARVNFIGAWKGAVDLECDRHQARHFAARFLGPDRLEDPAAIAPDVLGELINMIGGNLKCVLDCGMILSSPSVASEAAVDSGGRSEAHHRMAFSSGEGTFWVGLLDRL